MGKLRSDYTSPEFGEPGYASRRNEPFNHGLPRCGSTTAGCHSEMNALLREIGQRTVIACNHGRPMV